MTERSCAGHAARRNLGGMLRLACVPLFLALLPGCTVAKAAVDVATLPVKAVSSGVDAATTSQSEADEKRGRELRKQDEERGRLAREMQQRCAKGRPLPADVCEPAPPR